MNNDQERILRAVYAMCEALTAKRCLAIAPTNAELAAKYRISPRTVRNWRREGCPFPDGQRHVLDWLVRRRYAPAGARAKFSEQLERGKLKLRMEEFFAMLDQARQLKYQYQQNGLTPSEWLRGLRAKRGFPVQIVQ